MRLKKWLTQPLTMLIFLSFLLGLSNFLDTFLRLLFSYMLPVEYPLNVSLKPFFFGFQALCFILFIIYKLRNSEKLNVDGKIFGLLGFQAPVFGITVFLFVLYQLDLPGKYGFTLYTTLIWLACYIVGLSITSFWFGSKLKKQNYQRFSLIFLLIGFVFLANVLAEIYLLPQTMFSYALPPIVDQIGRFTPPVFMVFALFYTQIYLTLRRSLSVSFTAVFQFFIVIVALVLPFFLNNYKEGLINMIIRAIVMWGLGYSGYSWYYAGLYLAAIATYIFLIKDLNASLDDSLASNLVLLGAISFPWNGIMVYEFGYSSIPGNLLSLDALITGFFMLRRHKELIKPNFQGVLDTN